MNTQGIGEGVVYWTNIDLANVQYADFSKVEYSKVEDSEIESTYDDDDQGKTTGVICPSIYDVVMERSSH